eukprot:scaffold301240_cov34-Tisochrysis_lutea.AAC.1
MIFVIHTAAILNRRGQDLQHVGACQHRSWHVTSTLVTIDMDTAKHLVSVHARCRMNTRPSEMTAGVSHMCVRAEEALPSLIMRQTVGQHGPIVIQGTAHPLRYNPEQCCLCVLRHAKQQSCTQRSGSVAARRGLHILEFENSHGAEHRHANDVECKWNGKTLIQ